MKSTKFIVGIVVLAASLTAVGAFAQGQAKRHGFGHGAGHGQGMGMHGQKGMGMRGEKMSFETLDTDGNGEITLEEMQNLGGERFNDVDTNHDGKLSPAEMEAHAQKQTADRVALMIERHDEDDDGMLSMDELPRFGRGEQMFEHADQDGSGSISQEEFEEARNRMMQHGKRNMDKN